MKNYIWVVLFLFICELSFAQASYKYVIIPTQFREFNNEFNPFGLSSTMQKILREKNIESVIESNEKAEFPCSALIVFLKKTSTMVTNKVKVELKNCQGEVVWTGNGAGMSKGFREGYTEALTDAMSKLKELPQNTIKKEQPVIIEKLEATILSGESESIYKPKNLYFNDTYFVDLVSDGDKGIKKLIIVNGKLLGYNKLQEIATLTPSGLGDTYIVQWVTPQGAMVSGMAILTEKELNLSLSSEGKTVVIRLLKQ